MPQSGPFHFTNTYLRLRADASAEPLTVDESFWERLSTGQLGNFHDEYLISYHVFAEDWSAWEMHPMGDEIVCLLSGAVTFMLEADGGGRDVELDTVGDYAIIPRSTWHTARVRAPALMLFITPGENTQHRKIPA
ncbi:cupin domain-containing protein [Litchfieldella xinjiangensis]|uniref:cupin domain-containing protein n=1 Tax=Litchfieldella xinjiangensis TaxID=1166948 RepID=UPI0005B7E38D|nr:cupin domain-containing protein [Halomonas xinjiangensis]